ncbi:cis-zeatin O-beta-D-glucosyltransferase [Ranunculus cassubicifolius]
MSHCGWNSTIESLSMGVPVAAWPMHSDQPYNAFLITEVLKAGLIVREWSRRKDNEIDGIRLSDDGSVMRKKAKILGMNVRKDVLENGRSTTQLESLLHHISR